MTIISEINIKSYSISLIISGKLLIYEKIKYVEMTSVFFVMYKSHYLVAYMFILSLKNKIKCIFCVPRVHRANLLLKLINLTQLNNFNS